MSAEKSLAFAAVFMASLWCGSAALAAHKVTVRAEKVACWQAPVTLTIPADLVGKAVVLTDDSGDEVPAQPDRVGGKEALTWIVANLKAGEARSYKLEAGSSSAAKTNVGVELVKTPKGMGVRIDGKPFTTYQTDLGPKPYCWPLIGPTDKPITRAYPMQSDIPGEKFDHEHHRSFWFTFDKVNGSDFWSESDRAGKSVHREYLETTSGPVFGQFTSAVDWIGKNGEKVCEDIRRFRIYRAQDARLLDFEIALKASEGELTFGDSKEGLFAFRMSGTITVDQPKGAPAGGTLVNSNGEENQATWGKRATWCDYYGPLEGEVVGLAIFDHPSNFRHPTYWHSRTYGLFAANPFGISQFTNDKTKDGTHKVPAGQELRFNYRVYMHKGDAATAKVADHYAAYASPVAVTIE